MGNRAHVHMFDRTGGFGNGLWVYSHDDGWKLPGLVADGLQLANGVWSEPMYTARAILRAIGDGIAADKILQQDQTWGVSTRPADTSDGGRVVVVDLSSRLVALMVGFQTADQRLGMTRTYGEFASQRPGWPREGELKPPRRIVVRAADSKKLQQ